MKIAGDISESDREWMKQLEEQEAFWDSKYDTAPLRILAKAYVCLAHDWYQLGVEEQGNSLLEKAESACPGYFKYLLPEDTKDDETYDFLVKNLTSSIASIILNRINEMKGN